MISYRIETLWKKGSHSYVVENASGSLVLHPAPESEVNDVKHYWTTSSPPSAESIVGSGSFYLDGNVFVFSPPTAWYSPLLAHSIIRQNERIPEDKLMSAYYGLRTMLKDDYGKEITGVRFEPDGRQLNPAFRTKAPIPLQPSR